jgi:hypothetical protein
VALDAKEAKPAQLRAGSPVGSMLPPTPLNHYRTPSISSSASHTSKSGPAAARKVTNKRSHIENSLEASASKNTKLLELAKGSYDLKTASLAAKRQKMELKAEQEREGQRFAAEERALMIKERMQEKEFEHRERMMKYELELAQLKGQASGTTPQPALGGTAFPLAGSGSFGHSAQVGIYTTPDNSTTYDNFTFPPQHSSATPSPDSEAWGPMSTHGLGPSIL